MQHYYDNSEIGVIFGVSTAQFRTMHLWYSLLLLLVTFTAGSVPLWMKWESHDRMHHLLAFSGSFLLGITMLHLLPESFEELHHSAGIYLLGGFFLQLLIQRITHGAEHGHMHVHPNGHPIALLPVLIGLSVHAFMEGLPLGFNYSLGATTPALFLAVAVHKMPEAMLVASLALALKGRRSAWLALGVFSLITPLAALFAFFMEQQYVSMSTTATILLPVVAGAFIHISTTIFFESGTRQHMMSWQKVASMLLGVGLALLTLAFE